MLNENNNNSCFSPKSACLLEEYKRDLELIKRELENEKLKAQEDRKKYKLDLKQFKEVCEKEKNKLLDDLTSRWDQQKNRELQQLKDSLFRERELEIKQLMRWKDEELREIQTFLEKERDSAVRQARELQKQLIDELLKKGNKGKSSVNKKSEPNSPLSSECHCKVQDVLSKLKWEHDGEQAARIRHLKMELELERSLFIKYILDRSDSIASAILKDTTKPFGCREIKFGRHSLGSCTVRQWSLDETSLRQRSLENAGFRRRYGQCTLSRTRSLESAFPRVDSPLNSTEKSWKESPEIERHVPINRDSPGNHSSEITFALLETKNDCTIWSSLHEKFIQNSPSTEDSPPNSSDLIASISSARSADMSDFNQTHGASSQDVSISQNCESQECDATAAKELSNRVVPLVMFSSCEVPSESLMDVEHPEVLVKDNALPVEQLMDVEHSDVALKEEILPNKDPQMKPTITPVDIYKNVALVDQQIGNVSAISASLDVPVTSLPRTKLQGFTSVSTPTAEQEMPVCPLENGIRPSGSDSLINSVHTVCKNEEKCNTHCTNASDGSQSTQELLNALRDLEQRCKDLREENIILRKSSVPETEEKVKRLKRKNAELAVIAKRLEERAQKLQEANLRMVNTPIHLKGTSLELCKKAFARQRAKDMREQANALLEKDKQIENLKQECQELQAKLCAGKMQDFPSLVKFNDFNRLLHESQKEVLRLQKQIAMKYMKESLHLSRTESHSSPTPSEALCFNRLIHPEQPTQDPDNSILATSGDSFQELELRRKRKECEILEQDVKKKQKRCEELEIRLQEVQSENERLVEENSRLCSTVKRAAKVGAENADLKRDLSEATEQRDSALKENHRLHSKLENLEQVLRHMRDVAERRQQLEKDHEDAILALQKRQEEVKRLQQAQADAKKEHEGAVHLLENTLDHLQAKVKVLEEKCRTQTEQFSLLSQELEKFRLQTGNIDLLTSTLVNSELPPPQCCSTPSLSSVQQNKSDEYSSWDVISWVDISLDCSTPSFIYLSIDGIQFQDLFMYYNPFDGPNENPEAELPLTAGEYIYIYGDMDDDGFYEGELMDGRRGLVPSNFVERVSDDDLIAFHPGESSELSHSSAKDISFLSGSSIERSEEDDDPSSLSPLPLQGNGEGAAEISAVPYPRKLTLIKQLARSVVVGWEPPLVAAGSGNILSYNIYVDNELRQNVRCGGQTKALIEKLELKTRTYRISVQSMTENGCSDRMRCTMLVGHGYTLAPTQLRVRSLSATSAEITWQPCNSNYPHALYLNEESCGLAKAGTYWYTFASLRPSTMYNVKVEARPQRIPLELPMERREPKATVMQLTTPAAGPPDAPLDVQVELGPKPGVLLITWLPVTIDAAGTSNGVRVIGYAVYADGQKVLEVSSPTAGSVLVGTSHLHLLQVSREISVRTISPSGESVDSVPAQIPSAFIKVPDSPSLSQIFSNSSLTCEQPLASLPSMPLISSSPCSLHNQAASTPQANLSMRTGCSTGDSIDSLPVQVVPHLPISPLGASSGYCQESSILEPSDLQMFCQGTKEKLPSSLPDPSTLLLPGKTVSNCSVTLQSKDTALPDSQKQFPETKELEIGDKALCGLPLGVTWKGENATELNATNAKEDCSSPETGLLDDAQTTTNTLSYRGVSLEDFLDGNKERNESSGSNITYGKQDTGELLLDTHSSVLQMDHSRSSNLSDILEEEEYEEDEDTNVTPSAQKWARTSKSPVTDGLGKLDCCETDSDDEVHERILDLPLQKHCSKRLFSIPEVTEEEDEEEENSAQPAACKASHVETPKCYYFKKFEAFSQKPVDQTCSNLSSEQCCRDISGNSNKAECSVNDCVLQGWQQRTGSYVSQSPCYSVRSTASESQLWNAKKNSSTYEKTQCVAESNRKNQSEGREHCSRLSSNADQVGLCNSRCPDVKETVFSATTREACQVGHRNIKVSRSYQKRQPAIPTNIITKSPSTFSSRHLEIDIEYDTEDEDDLSVPTYYATQTKTDIWEDSSQTDWEAWSESSDYSEPFKVTRRKEVKRQPKVQTGTTDCLKRHTSLLHIDKIHGGQQSNNKEDQGFRKASNKTMRKVRWEGSGKDEWKEEPMVPLHLDNTETTTSEKNIRLNHLASDSEPDFATLAECHQDNRFQEQENISRSHGKDFLRMFVALFDYDPETMSPNPDAYMEELPFKEGQILQVFGEKDTDGFYQGKHGERTGYIPCNMVSELHIENEEIRRELLRRGHLTSPSILNDLEISAFSPPTPPPIAPPGRSSIPPPKPRRSKKVRLPPSLAENIVADKHLKTSKSDLSISRNMVAMFDYNPRESSPNMDVEAELSFTAGDVITVFGPMDEDGFYYGELNGQRGFVPSNYLEVSQTEELKSQETVHTRGEKEFSCDVAADQSYPPPNESISCDQASESKETSERSDICQEFSTKKKKSFFSKGKKLFKKLGSSGKNL
ncbi:peripheral-type benzodiazepine receptor-associated protein 1 [Pyxicephalus adspersus]|uniref:peripheral-type benzodiazepine receptor-associated protein 1 n=1 Tax=Pyxicephalus adspersus TaxID=30357 RepID=UPI003B5C1CEF